MTVEALAYVADAAVLGAYFATKHGKPVLWMDWANFLGAIPIIVIEVNARLWQALILTAAFGLIGLYGIINERIHRGTKPS